MTQGFLGTKASPYSPPPTQGSPDFEEAISQFQVVFDWTNLFAVTRNFSAISSRVCFEFLCLRCSLVIGAAKNLKGREQAVPSFQRTSEVTWWRISEILLLDIQLAKSFYKKYWYTNSSSTSRAKSRFERASATAR